MVNVQVFDGLIPRRQRIEVWDYIQDQPWHVHWKPTRPYPGNGYDYIPSQESDWRRVDPIYTAPNMVMPRACFASDDASLEERHPVIWKLWNTINGALDNQYVISGPPEGMVTDSSDDPKWTPPPTKDPSLPQGWRVYGNCQPSETVKRTHGIHRDTIDVNDDNSFTLLYVANLEWFPSWFAECVFFPNDPKRQTGDTQQYQGVSPVNQSRNFPIGWLDDGGKTVCPVPGRIMLYDGRTLHTTRPASFWAKESRKTIAFRIRKKV